MKSLTKDIDVSIDEIDYPEFYEHSFDIIQSVDQFGNLLYVNPTWCEKLGYTRKEIQEINLWDIMHPSMHEHCKNLLGNLSENSRFSDLELSFVSKTGELLNLTGNVYAQSMGNRIITHGIFRDDTKEKKLLDELQKSEQKYRTLVENAEDMIFETDAKGRFSYVNPKLAKISGYSTSDLLGMSYLELIPKEYHGSALTLFREHLKEKKKSAYYEFKMITADGKIKWVGQTVRTIFDDQKKKIVGFYAVARNITKNKEQELALKKAHDSIVEKNTMITSSLRYARMIQRSHLTNPEVLKQYFQEYVLYYQPRDIVSGDFYWFGETTDRFIVVVGDCTGHGIPGGFLTMIALNQLNTIVHEKRIADPSRILAHLDSAMNDGLSYRYRDDEILDGMEVAVCSFDKNDKMLYFSGAKRSLIHYSNGERTIVKPTNKSIGEIHPSRLVSYAVENIQYQDGDSFYMFSDGVTDQFGGKKSKKFSFQRMFKLLDTMNTKNGEKQYKLLDEALTSWMKSDFQTDDMVFLGLKV